MSGLKTITLDGIEYVRVGSYLKEDELDGMRYAIIRTQSAGVFAGYIESKDGKQVVIRKARRLWYWEGAASLSQLAQSGTSKPESCKFPEEVDRIEVTEAIEILDATAEAKKTIDTVRVWKS